MADESTVSAEVIGFAPLGEVFASARNAKNIALKDVSNNLRLSIKQIEALESNDFASLPPAMITRGFIRNYARLLELDAEPLLASYRARVPEALPTALSVQTSMNQVMPGNSKPSSIKYFVIAGLIAFSLITGWYYSNHMQKPASAADESLVESSDNQAATAVAELPEVALPAAERQFQADAASVEPAVIEGAADAATVNSLPLDKSKTEVATTAAVNNAVQANNTVEASSKLVPAAEVASLPVVSTPSEQAPKDAAVDFKALKEKAALKQSLSNISDVKPASTDLTTSGLKTDSKIASIKGVNIAVTEQTWVRVTDKTGAVVYEKLLQPNSEDGFDGLPPFKVLVGNAKATKLSFMGQDVDLTEKARNNVARVTLE